MEKQYKIQNLDRRLQTLAANVPEDRVCFYRAMHVQAANHGDQHLIPRFGILFHWEKVDSRYVYNPIWQQHVWFVEKATGDIFDSHRAIAKVLEMEAPGVDRVFFDSNTAIATVTRIKKIRLTIADLDRIDALAKTPYLYLEGSFLPNDSSPELIAYQEAAALATRNNVHFDYMTHPAYQKAVQMELFVSQESTPRPRQVPKKPVHLLTNRTPFPL